MLGAGQLAAHLPIGAAMGAGAGVGFRELRAGRCEHAAGRGLHRCAVAEAFAEGDVIGVAGGSFVLAARGVVEDGEQTVTVSPVSLAEAADEVAAGFVVVADGARVGVFAVVARKIDGGVGGADQIAGGLVAGFLERVVLGAVDACQEVKWADVAVHCRLQHRELIAAGFGDAVVLIDVVAGERTRVGVDAVVREDVLLIDDLIRRVGFAAEADERGFLADVVAGAETGRRRGVCDSLRE